MAKLVKTAMMDRMQRGGQGRLIRVGHSPDPDDAFMFHALANDRIDTGPYRFEHEMADIESLNRRAFSGELELTAVSLHAYAHISDRYALCTCGASMGDGYGPMLVCRGQAGPHELSSMRIAVPGTMTTAFLALRLFLGADFSYGVVPFDAILEAVAEGGYRGEAYDAGLIIHEGQLTYTDHKLERIVDLGAWWKERTGLPLPLGANAIRKDLGPRVMSDVNRLLRRSIQYGLEHRREALEHAMRYGRDLDMGLTDRFVGMYVNEWTLDFGPRGRHAVSELLGRAHLAGLVPAPITPEFVSEAS
jgi:1,4-dihydroxy-6-naphthoate synthase